MYYQKEVAERNLILRVNNTASVFSGLNVDQKEDQNWVLKSEYRLMQVLSIAECSKRAFCNTFDLH